MRLAALSFVLLAATFATAQQTATSKAECQADAIAWNVTADGIQKLQDGPLSIKEIDARAVVMFGCSLAHAPGEQSSYSVLADVYEHAAHIRLIDFMKRNPEIQAKFLQEDQAGLR